MNELYLDNIDEYINDHNKIVTYKWLSLTLGVHVNTAKQMLFHYLGHKRREGSAQLHATYLLSGKCMENGQTSHRVSVVREADLEEYKAKMSLVVSIHVYSVQKAALRDSGPLYTTDYDAVRENMDFCSRFSAIRCAAGLPMSAVIEAERPTTPQQTMMKLAVNGQTSTADRVPTKPAKGIMGMVVSKEAPRRREVKAEPKEEVPVVEAPKSRAVVKMGPMSPNFLSPQTGKRPERSVKEKEEEQGTQSPLTAGQRPQSSPPPEAPEITAAVTVEPPKATKKDPHSKTKRVEGSDSEEEQMGRKKRRRIKKLAADSSEEDLAPDSPLKQRRTEAPPSPRGIEGAEPQEGPAETKRRKKRRVLKSHTFVDDEGCIVTEKMYESESYSDAEDDVQAAKPSTKTLVGPSCTTASSKAGERKKRGGVASRGGRQASITGFFQKK